jgi:uncharacterized protein YyaL (SSP411 family)
MANRLGESGSAYLRSAAHQPIHWYPWGEAAFRAAREGNRPVLLDIGAVWCHWCHVMDGESYEDPGLAEFLNEHFVCIKVDRDERPDVDTRYQRAVQAFTGQGGWPLTAFLTPEGQVFYGGTYFPPDGKYGRPGFRTVLEQVRKVFHEQRDRVEQQAGTLRRLLAPHLDEGSPGEPGEALLAEATGQITLHHDPVHGGFGTEPKFPHPGAVRFLLTRAADTGQAEPREIALHTLAAMGRGGIHDQLGGGFHRYSVDAKWIVPHFEKMAYDNAELLKAYLDGYAASGAPELRAVAEGIVGWVREVLADPEGGYGASQDADVGLDDDGDYFTWTLDEAQAALGDPALLELACAYWDIGTAGEMQHDPSRNVLFVAEPLERIARRLGVPLPEAERRLGLAREKLLAARAARPVPYVDRTRYAAWNGMLAGAMIQAGLSLDDEWALDHALRTLRRLQAEQPDLAAILHAPHGVGGLLDDQVQVAQALLDAVEATGDGQWLAGAARIMEKVWSDYRDPEKGGLWDQARDREALGLLPERVKPVQDTPTPSPNGTAGIVLARLAAHTQAPEWASRQRELVAAFAGGAAGLGLFGAAMLAAIDWAVHPPTHAVIVEGDAPGDAERARALHRLACQAFLPRRVIQWIRPGTTVPLPPAVAAMRAAADGTRAYLCRGATCEAPATTEEEWRATLGLPT